MSQELAKIAKIAISGSTLAYLSFQKGRDVKHGKYNPQLDRKIETVKKTFEDAVNNR